jgi:squalene-hopene/tetraprenyl-beta-curcumene cyclase
MTRLKRAIDSTIQFLEGQRRQGFSEACHRMLFPRAAGFGGDCDERVGLVLQRALIAEALLDAGDAGFQIDRNGLSEDIQSLAALKCQDVAGGWRYFPTLPELPPDADDLGAILRLFVRARHPDIAKICDYALHLVLAQRSASSGGFSTWIVDYSDRSEITLAMRRAIESQWGDGIDVEVVANLLHALVLYDATRFRNEIAKGADYVASRQQSTGAWRSTWYHGDFYGTLVCARFLAAVAPTHEGLGRVASMLVSTQGDDGGWGKPASTPTDTALALLTAELLRTKFQQSLQFACARAREYLLGYQAIDGHWPANDFIKMDTNRVRTLAGVDQPRILSYRSVTVTSALCLQALSAVEKGT